MRPAPESETPTPTAADVATNATPGPVRDELRALALLFGRLGATAFGGPAAHVAMMHDEVVVRRRWMTDERFLDLLGATNLIPGPSSTELAIHVGWERARGAGLVVAGVAFILPAMLISAACAEAYLRFGSLPQATALLYGVKPVVLGVVVQAIWNLLPKAASTTRLRLLGAAAIVLAAIGVDELVVLGLAALASALSARIPRRDLPPPPAALLPLAAAGAVGAVGGVTLHGLFGSFLKIGSVLFGSGYVLLAFVREEFVTKLHWLTEAQILDAIAIGQTTPGPVFTTATFLGYVLAGPSGALVSTAGIFLPAFVFVALSGPFVPRLRASPLASALLDGVNVASLALMAVVTAELGRAAIVDLPTAALAIAASVVLVRTKTNSTWLVLSGAVAGLALSGC